MGVPQGGIISPLLSNLVLHELDVYISSLIKEREKANEGIPMEVENTAYFVLSNLLSKKKRKLQGRVAKEKKRHLSQLEKKEITSQTEVNT